MACNFRTSNDSSAPRSFNTSCNSLTPSSVGATCDLPAGHSSRTTNASKNLHALCLAFALACTALLCALSFGTQTAWADNAESSTGNACVLSDDDRTQYEADGTLEERIAYMQQLRDGSGAQGLIQAALARENGIETASDNVPAAWKGGMGTTGNAYVLGIAVEFPAEGTEAATTFDDAQKQASNFVKAIEGGTGYSSPYESVQAYYLRSSYGKLNISCRGTCYVVTAKHCRSYYKDRASLISEITATLHDEQSVDFAQFDGNSDGYVDCVYAVFAGQTTGWGSLWWPTESNSTLNVAYDGEQLKSNVLINAVDSADLVRTLIHETGHVLGLPDYYCYTSATDGINTTDMMYHNTGDQDAFSKWLLGWIDDSQIIRVAVTENGIKVRRGFADVETYTGSTTETLGAFTSENMAEGGSFIAVSNDEGILEGALFTKFYLLQYDQPAGNQNFSEGDAAFVGGLRVYRVQAGLNSTGTDFAASNSGSTYQHDMLIEALKPSDGGAAAELGDAFHTGAAIGTSTKPSTNFREDLSGYTGIHIDVTNADAAAQGIVTISRDEQPPQTDFSVTPNSNTGILDKGALTFTLSNAVDQSPTYVGATLRVDGKEYSVQTSVSLRSLNCIYSLPAGTIKADSTCELVLPEGFFSIYGKATPEIHVALSPRTQVADLSDKGSYENCTYQSFGSTVLMSNVAEVGGRKVMVETYPTSDTLLSMKTLTLSEDGSTCELGDISGISIDSTGVSTLEAYALSNGQLLVHALGTTWLQKTFEMLYWIDPTTNTCVKSENISFQGLTCVMPLGDGVMLTQPKSNQNAGKISLWIQSDGTEKYLTLRGMRVVGTGDNRVATLTYNKGSEGQVSIYSASQLAKIAEDASAYDSVAPDVQLSIPVCDCVEDVQVRDGVIYVLARTTENGASTLTVYRFSQAGELKGSTAIEGSGAIDDTISELILGDAGAVAVRTTSLATSSFVANIQEIAVLAADGSFAGFTSVRSGDAVYWAGGHLYIAERGFDMASGTGTVNWSRTGLIDVAQPEPEPSPAPSPSPQPAGGDNGTANASASQIAQTGDATTGLAGFAAATFACALASLCAARRGLRSKK